MYTVYCVFCLLLKAATLLKSLLLRLWKHQLQRLWPWKDIDCSYHDCDFLNYSL
jgi:hypothetical protein